MTVCLVVDDSTTQRKLMKKIAESCGVDVTEAKNGLDALKQCEENVPDIIILDINMPGMSGLEFLNSLREMPKEYSPYIIVCSANINTDDIVAAVKAGADAYHCKSTDIDNLRSKIKEAFEKSGAR